MTPKYDLIIEKDGNLTVMRLNAKSREEAKKLHFGPAIRLKPSFSVIKTMFQLKTETNVNCL